MQPGQTLIDDATRVKLGAYGIGLMAATSVPYHDKHLHLASGFLFDVEDGGGRCIVTVKHFAENILRWHRNGTLNGFGICHRCLTNEDYNIQVQFDPSLITDTISLATNGCDTAIVLLPEEVNASLIEHDIPAIGFEKHFKNFDERHRSAIAVGYSVYGTTSMLKSRIYTKESGANFTHDVHGFGAVCNRIEPLKGTLDDNGAEWRFTLSRQDAPSLDGMSGSPVIALDPDDPLNFRLIGQQIREMPKGSFVEYAVATNVAQLAQAIGSCKLPNDKAF